MTIEQLSILKCYVPENEKVDVGKVLPLLREALPYTSGETQAEMENVIERLSSMAPEEIARIDLTQVPATTPQAEG
jgi:hypothetical protein